MPGSLKIFLPALAAALAAPLYMTLNNKGFLCDLLGCGITNMLNELFYPALALSCLAGSIWLSRNLGLRLRVAYLAFTSVVVIGVCLIFVRRLIHWL